MNIGIICARGAEKNGSVQWINQQIRTELQRLEIQEAYSCMMNEADYLMCRIILQHKLQLVKVHPAGSFQLLGTDFFPARMPDSFPKSEDASPDFYEAGEKLVNQVDILIAVWNNLPQKGSGDIANLVAYAKTINKTIIQLNPANKSKKILKKWQPSPLD